MKFLGKMVAGTLIVLVTLTIVVVGCSAAATAAPAAPQAATGYATFQYPRLVSTFMVSYLNDEPEFTNVRATSVNRYRIVLKGRYEYSLNFTAHLTKAGRQTVKITMYARGTHLSDTINVGMDI